MNERDNINNSQNKAYRTFNEESQRQFRISETKINKINLNPISECLTIVMICIPVIFSYLIEFFNPFITNYSVGWIGKEELASSALSTMFANMTGFAFALGMTSCLETLCSQAYTGSADIKQVGIYAQKGFFVTLCLFFPISIIWLNAKPILLFIGQDEGLSELCSIYLKWLLLAIPPFIGFECLKKFLQAQGIMNASVYILISNLPICAILNYLLVWYPPTSIGFIGAPIALAITTWCSFIFGILYISFIDGKKAWGGFTVEAFKGWGSIINLGIPGVVMLCSEWWAYEILAFCASYIDMPSLAAHGSLSNLGALFYQISVGTGTVASNFVGNALGEADAFKAKRTAFNCIVAAGLYGLMSCLFILIFSPYLKNFNNDDPQFVAIVEKVLPVLACFQIVDVLAGVCGGIMRGMGRQDFGAKLNLFVFLLVATPTGMILAFPFGFKLPGLWVGLVVGSGTITLASIVLIYNVNWDDEIEKAKLRIE